jgi:hypothetical protein
MFAKAYQIASAFTRPVVISWRNVDGTCTAAIGTFVVLNDQGWVLTAWHIIELIAQKIAECTATRDHVAKSEVIRNDASLDKRERERRLRKLGTLAPTATTNCSIWWGADGLTAVENKGLPDVDLGIARLDPFDPTAITTYPTLKAPGTGIHCGTSLCKLGFPFTQITPTWDSAKNAFTFPPGSLPLPFFPIDGIFTRTLNFPDRPNQTYPLMLIETSSPGLMGQSGGPTFDVNGVVWAIQSRTRHLPLGFNPEVPGQKNQREHQFLNVGRGIHTETIIGFLKQNNIKHAVSDY